jgi:hypothetical protein
VHAIIKVNQIKYAPWNIHAEAFIGLLGDLSKESH